MKKVLSFVLVLSLVLSSFSMAFAGTTPTASLSDIEGNINEEAIEVAYDLGIVTGNPDGTFQPEKAVTRAEFAAMITRALAIPDSALAGYASTSFNDTDGYGWAVQYLAFCNSKGIMLGDGAGNAMPGRTITVNEAVTMVLRAVGYTANSAELVGTWPSNYVTKAQELDLYDDVAKNVTGVDKANAAQIIYNALTVQKVAVNADGDTNKLWLDNDSTNNAEDNKVTLLSSGLNCTPNVDQIVGVDMDIDETLINMAKHLGKFGTIYTNEDKEIVAFISDSDQLVGRFNDAMDTFVATADETEYNVKLTTATGIELLVNGKDQASAVALTDLSKKASGTEYVLNVDLSGKTIKEIYSAVEWTVTEASMIEASEIADIEEDHSLLGKDFIEDDNDDIDFTQFQLVGVASLSDIAEDDVVYVYADGDDIRKVEVGTNTVTGTVKKYEAVDEDDAIAAKYTVDSVVYKNAADVINGNADNGSSLSDSNVSDDVTLYLDARGFVYDFDDTASADDYAFVEKADATGINPEAKVLFADGTGKVVSWDDDEVADLVDYSLIGYGLNSDGVIDELNNHYVYTDALYLASSKVLNATAAAVTNGNSASAGAIEGNAFDADIDSDCVVFVYDDLDLTKADLEVTTIDKIDTETLITSTSILLFDQDSKGVMDGETVVAMVIYDGFGGTGDEAYAVINEMNSVANEDGDKVWEVVGYKDGSKLNALTDNRGSDQFPSWTAPAYAAGTGITTAHLYEITVDSDGVITKTEAVSADVTGTATKANDRKSVIVNGNRLAIAENAIIYRVDVDEYELYSGNLKDGDAVWMYETDDDYEGYDIVFFGRE